MFINKLLGILLKCLIIITKMQGLKAIFNAVNIMKNVFEIKKPDFFL